MGSYFHDQGLNPRPLPWMHRVLIAGPPRMPLSHLLMDTWDGHLVHTCLGYYKQCCCEHQVYVSFHISVFIFPDIYPGVELLDHMLVPFLVF